MKNLQGGGSGRTGSGFSLRISSSVTYDELSSLAASHSPTGMGTVTPAAHGAVLKIKEGNVGKGAACTWDHEFGAPWTYGAQRKDSINAISLY